LLSSVNSSDRIRALKRALGDVRQRIARACRSSGRDEGEVRLIAVTKGVPPDVVAVAANAGVAEFGENYVAELVTKRDLVPAATWHFLGRLQSNKVNQILAAADVVQTLEPGRAGQRLAASAQRRGRPIPALVEVDFTGRRVGVIPDEAEAFIEQLRELPGLSITGLMTIAPLDEDPRPSFARLRGLRDRVRERFEDVTELSMGMSADLEAAVEEGATMVRIGTAIFGARTDKQLARG
jgi:pyridoxal phosphate enzyme (YggS family)